MTNPKKLRGVVVPMSTPVTASGAIDVEAAKRMSRKLTENECSVFVLGTTGEASSVSLAEREKLVAAAVEAVDSKLPVYAGIGSDSLETSVSMAKAYFKLGAGAVVAHPPSFYHLNPAELQTYFETLAARIPGSLVLYNIPQTTHVSIPVEVVDHLSSIPNISGFKDSENTAGRMHAVAERFRGRKDFSIFMGVALHSVASLELGFNGLVPSSANVAPDLWRQLWEKAEALDWEGAHLLQKRADKIGQIFQRGRSLGQSLAALKAGCASLGLCESHMLAPLQALPKEEVQAIGLELANLLSGEAGLAKHRAVAH